MAGVTISELLNLLPPLLVAAAIGSAFACGRRIGRNEERVRRAMRDARKRRPIHVSVDYDMAVRALDAAGFSVHAKRKLH